MRKMNLVLALLAFVFSSHAAQLEMKVTKPYLIMPVSQQAERKTMSFVVKGETERTFVIRLSASPEYEVSADVSRLKGQRLTIQYDGESDALSLIRQSDVPAGWDEAYGEENRPLFHFTTRCGWMNDPNGLVFYEGEYHLFYQHNPYEREWGNMHWGHAVSKDLLHWEELPEALYPDSWGTMFSGSAVIDYANTSGFGTKDKPAMVAIYTADRPGHEVQCVAYSLDKGRTWTKYDGNPVIDSKAKWNSGDTRDPKVFWYAPEKMWVMVLNERDGHSIYNSPNLKDWTFQSHIVGFWECPELFELPVDGDENNRLWVLYAASGNYMLGHFDGHQFSPVTGKRAYCFGSVYAAQTYNNIPVSDGRRIQIGWDRVDQPGMSFKGQMSLPNELTLRTTADGVRLFCNPVKEMETLNEEPVVAKENLSIEAANQLLASYGNEDALHMKVTMQFTHSTSLGLNLCGQHVIDYDLNGNRINGFFYSQNDFSQREVSAEIFVDKTSIQVYFDEGGMSYCIQRDAQRDNKEGFYFWANKPASISRLELCRMKSIWER